MSDKDTDTEIYLDLQDIECTAFAEGVVLAGIGFFSEAEAKKAMGKLMKMLGPEAAAEAASEMLEWAAAEMAKDAKEKTPPTPLERAAGPA